MPDAYAELTMSQVVTRSGVSASALRFYEAKGLIRAHRDRANRRTYPRHVLRRLAVIRSAQTVGLSLREIADALAIVPQDRALSRDEWQLLGRAWQDSIDQRIAALVQLRDRMAGCIGCGCLSLDTCPLQNPDDQRGAEGPGPRSLPAILTLNDTSRDDTVAAGPSPGWNKPLH